MTAIVGYMKKTPRNAKSGASQHTGVRFNRPARYRIVVGKTAILGLASVLRRARFVSFSSNRSPSD